MYICIYIYICTDMYGKSPHYWVRRVRVVVGEWGYMELRDNISILTI